MGQYYKACSLDKKEGLSPYDYREGSKLLEHSFVGNHFVNHVENLIAQGGEWHENRIVWAGDYADPEEGEKERNLYDLVKVRKYEPESKQFDYLINLDKKVYVEYSKIPEEDGFALHPLPLLTCEGNGRGGGDYNVDSELIGCWARDKITVSNEKPSSDYEELIFDFVY